MFADLKHNLKHATKTITGGVGVSQLANNQTLLQKKFNISANFKDIRMKQQPKCSELNSAYFELFYAKTTSAGSGRFCTQLLNCSIFN